MGRSFFRLVGYLRPYVPVLVVAVLCAAGYAGARAGRAWLIQPVLDDVLLPQLRSGDAAGVGGWIPGLGAGEGAEDAPEGAAEAEAGAAPSEATEGMPVLRNLHRLALLAFLIAGILTFTHYGQLYLSEYVLGRVLVDIQQALCAKLLALPLRFHHGMARGETLSRVMNDATRAHLALDLLFADVVQSVLALGVGGAVLISISWQLTFTTLLVAPLVAAVIGIFGRRIRRTARRRQESQADVTQRMVQILAGIKVIKAFAAQGGEEEAFRRDNLRFFRRSMKVVKNRALSRTIVEGLTNVIGVAVFLLGAVVVMNGLWGLTLGSLAAFVGVMQTTYRPMKDVTKAWARLMDALPSAERFFDLLDARADVPDLPDALCVDGLHRDLRISKVSFSYGREPVLRDVSLDVRAGEVVAIVGRTGSGKTTLADLLLRFYDPDAGSIEVDGVDLRRVQRSSWMEQVAVVTQEPFLFAGTIRDNVRYARPDASDEAIDAALRAAHVDEFLAHLPDGIDTDVGDAGVRLSGGQRQRITIARAILKDPSILIFDEATSSLDARSERYVQEAIDALLAGRTVFVIAHRLSTVRHADKIVVLEDGAVADVGTHEELMERGGLYRELMRLQADDGSGPPDRPAS